MSFTVNSQNEYTIGNCKLIEKSNFDGVTKTIVILEDYDKAVLVFVCQFATDTTCQVQLIPSGKEFETSNCDEVAVLYRFDTQKTRGDYPRASINFVVDLGIN